MWEFVWGKIFSCNCKTIFNWSQLWPRIKCDHVWRIRKLFWFFSYTKTNFFSTTFFFILPYTNCPSCAYPWLYVVWLLYYRKIYREQPIFTCQAHVFHIDPKTKRTWITASTKAISVSFFYDSSRNLYRIISVEGSKVNRFFFVVVTHTHLFKSRNSIQNTYV